MATNRKIGALIAKVGLALIALAGLLFILVVISIYGFTSYYDQDWQYDLVSASGWLLKAGLLILTSGLLVFLFQKLYDKKH